MGGSSHTETSSTKVDPALMALYNQNYSKANELADMPFQPFTGERVAGFNNSQTAGFNALLAAAADPTAANAITKAQSSVGSLLDYRAPTIAAGQLADTDLTPYLNPYTDDVVNAALGDLQHAREVQGVSDNAAATAAHAFGGTRQAVLDANTTNDYLRNVGSTTAGLRQSAYQNAQQAALSDIANRLSASTSNAANDLAGANTRMNAANQYAALGNDYLSQAIRRGGLYATVGAQQQAQQQVQDDAAYEEFMRQLNYPYQQQQLRNQALGMMPMQSTTTKTDTSSGGLGGLLGGVGQVALGIGSLASGNPMGLMGIANGIGGIANSR
jgi:hypothetical protein